MAEVCCPHCNFALEKKTLLSHLEKAHTWPREIEEIKMKCSECPFKISIDSVEDMAAHILEENHSAQRLDFHWEIFIRTEEHRTRELVKDLVAALRPVYVRRKSRNFIDDRGEENLELNCSYEAPSELRSSVPGTEFEVWTGEIGDVTFSGLFIPSPHKASTKPVFVDANSSTIKEELAEFEESIPASAGIEAMDQYGVSIGNSSSDEIASMIEEGTESLISRPEETARKKQKLGAADLQRKYAAQLLSKNEPQIAANKFVKKEEKPLSLSRIESRIKRAKRSELGTLKPDRLDSSYEAPQKSARKVVNPRNFKRFPAKFKGTPKIVRIYAKKILDDGDPKTMTELGETSLHSNSFSNSVASTSQKSLEVNCFLAGEKHYIHLATEETRDVRLIRKKTLRKIFESQDLDYNSDLDHHERNFLFPQPGQPPTIIVTRSMLYNMLVGLSDQFKTNNFFTRYGKHNIKHETLNGTSERLEWLLNQSDDPSEEIFRLECEDIGITTDNPQIMCLELEHRKSTWVTPPPHVHIAAVCKRYTGTLFNVPQFGRVRIQPPAPRKKPGRPKLEEEEDQSDESDYNNFDFLDYPSDIK